MRGARRSPRRSRTPLLAHLLGLPQLDEGTPKLVPAGERILADEHARRRRRIVDRGHDLVRDGRRIGTVRDACGDSVVRLGQRGGVVRRRVDRRSLAIAVDLGREESRFDRNDTHAGPDELCVQRLAHPADRLLRGGVHREPAPSREACADSRKVNYHAGALRAHVRQHGLAKVDRAPEVCLPNEPRSRFVRLLDRFDEADTCVVHEHVDATSFGGDAGDDIAYRGAIGDVEPANDNGQRFARDRVAKPMIDRWVAHRRMDRVATAAERERRLVTDTGSTSGDQDRCHGGLSVRPAAIRRPSHPTCAANDARCDHSLERGQHSSAAAAVAPRWGSTLATAAGPAFAVSVPHTRRFVLGCEDSSPGRSRGSLRRCPYTQPPRGTGQAVTRGSSAALCRLCGRCFVTTPPIWRLRWPGSRGPRPSCFMSTPVAYLLVGSFIFCRISSRLKEAAFCRCGYSLNVARNWPTKA